MAAAPALHLDPDVMRTLTSFALASLAAVLAACAAEPSPQANGFNVELWFEAPSSLTVGTPSEVTVQRIQLQYRRCAESKGQCDPRAPLPLTLVSAACDEGGCTTEVSPSSDGSIVLTTTGTREGSTTLHVKARSEDGTVYEDAYPLTFRAIEGPVKQVPTK